MVNHIISKCSKLAWKEYKTMHNLVGKVIIWLVGFYGISTIVGYLIPNPVYTYNI